MVADLPYLADDVAGGRPGFVDGSLMKFAGTVRKPYPEWIGNTDDEW